MLAAALVAFLLPGPWPWRQHGPSVPAVPAAGRLYLGVDSSHNALAGYEAATGIAQPAILGGYTVGTDGAVIGVLSSVSGLPGTIPLVSWGVDLRGGAVASGAKDAYLREQAKAVVRFGKPVFIRLDWEMNGSWYPQWSAPAVGPSAYIAAWRHVVDVFRQAGASNAAFVWCPNDGEFDAGPWTRWYPGDAYVDWVGLDTYIQPSNQAAEVSGAGGLDDLAGLAARSGKPAMLAEWAPGAPSQDPAATFDAVFAWAERNPAAAKALVYFNYGSEQRDDLLADDPVGAARFRDFVARHRSALMRPGD
ncbi:MAG TPA: glycosyl hydrolase [Actinospica sp.]|nr:glycosyl hydrolase [Actinospica sp.]